MPFETGAVMRKKVAVIGAGISGMGAAHSLADTHDITLIEAEPRLGGHARTITAGKRGDVPVDTGFIVFNHANYPNLTRLFETLEVPVVKSNMSFGASVRGGTLEYGLAGAAAFFAQRRNALNPRFLRMLRDIFRFNARAFENAQDSAITIEGLLDRMQLGNYFRDYYLLPFSGAIWSTPKDQILDFPARAMVQFFKNHGLLGYSDQHQWYTVQGGSVSYVSRLEQSLRAQGANLRLGCPVAGVRRCATGAEVRVKGDDWEHFDEVVFATHSDQALALLSDASPRERNLLESIRYQPNDVVLHADSSVMPKRRAVWSSWNYAEGTEKRDGQIDVTYWMNSLQPISLDDPHFVTLNSNRPIREDLIYDEVTMRHPVYDLPALAAQEALRDRNGESHTWFCGAWMRHGFHEDGLASGLDVSHALMLRDTTPMAAE
ncbi:NAD(P)/FAD-dependent oxidoreductase [Roseovarius sp. SYSU LYC5161]|uniref:NAD(P)/FAD-dependent oxidoreductase n=1 Tax=Roseovarius halophilus (ex Wu et al. 2025) TaxID=3376060 RepID=UPI00399A93CA